MAGFSPVGGSPVGAVPAAGAPVVDLEPVLSEDLTFSEALLGGFDFDELLTETFSLEATSAGRSASAATIIDTLVVSAIAEALEPSELDITITETLALSTAATGVTPVAEALVDAVRFAAYTDASRGFLGELEDTVTLAVQALATRAVVVRERLRIAEQLTAGWRARAALTDAIRVLDAVRTGLPVSLSESIEVADEINALATVQVIERLRLGSTLTGAGRYGRSLVDTLRLADQLARFFGGEVTDGITLSDLLTSVGRLRGAATDTLGISDTLAPQFLLTAQAVDGIELTDDLVLGALFSPTVAETIVLRAGFVDPGGGFTAWSMNTRTAAVTEYTNTAFNSFARRGNVYLGASETGLYELRGDDDAGDPIIAHIRSGLMQFGGARLSRLKAAYIGLRGAGDYILKIETGDGAIYHYGVSPRNMRSTKVHMGKGQRARYFAFELIGEGEDFDLESIEFVPLVMSRRV